MRYVGPFEVNQIHSGHCLELLLRLRDNSVHACITSPPYWGFRDYETELVLWPKVSFSPMPGLPEITVPEQKCSLGWEKDIWSYTGHLIAILREIRRVLRNDGVLWLNLGDAYANDAKWGGSSAAGGYQRQKTHTGLKPKNMIMLPHRVGLASQADGWYVRSDIPWIKRNVLPGSQQDRPTTAKEYWLLLSKSERYYFDREAVKMPVARSSEARLDQDIEEQEGSHRAYGGAKTNGAMKAVGNPSGRYRRDTDWFFDSLRAILEDNSQALLLDEEGKPLALTINPSGYKKAHFATFPPKLIEPMILASTSDYGVCEACGAPWVRVFEKELVPTKKAAKTFVYDDRDRAGHTNNDQGSNRARDGHKSGHVNKVTTLDWRPSCACSAPVVPAVVLDPFIGSGTTGQAAIQHRREFIGFDLNPTYVKELAPDRLNGVQIRMLQ